MTRLLIQLSLVVLLVVLPGNLFAHSRQRTAFRPYGYYFIQGKVPKAFGNIDTIQYWLRNQESSGPDVSERLAGVNLVGGTRYRFATITVNRKNFSFTTRAVRGVHYTFSGRFLRTDFLNNELNEESSVARGTLVKRRNGIAVAQATVTLSYFSGT